MLEHTFLKVLDIAKLSGVAEGTIYEYFGSKENLLLSISLSQFKDYFDELSEIFQITRPIKKLRNFILQHFALFFSDKFFLEVFLLNILLNKSFLQSESFEYFQKCYLILQLFEVMRRMVC